MGVRIVAGYAAILGLIFIYLSSRVMAARRASGVALGTGGDRTLERWARVHANFAEYVPLAIILLVLMEIRGNAAWYLHLLCIGLVVGRVAHAFGLSHEPDRIFYRAAGVLLTNIVIIVAAITLLAGVL
jgi:uncharacterized membrane protein YecN with MAPEG domain